MNGEAYDRAFHPSGQARQLLAIREASSRTEALGAVRVPFLVLHGDQDRLVDPSGGRRTAEAVPGARFELIEGLGHDYPPAVLGHDRGLRRRARPPRRSLVAHEVRRRPTGQAEAGQGAGAGREEHDGGQDEGHGHGRRVRGEAGADADPGGQAVGQGGVSRPSRGGCRRSRPAARWRRPRRPPGRGAGRCWPPPCAGSRWPGPAPGWRSAWWPAGWPGPRRRAGRPWRPSPPWPGSGPSTLRASARPSPANRSFRTAARSSSLTPGAATTRQSGSSSSRPAGRASSRTWIILPVSAVSEYQPTIVRSRVTSSTSTRSGSPTASPVSSRKA